MSTFNITLFNNATTNKDGLEQQHAMISLNRKQLDGNNNNNNGLLLTYFKQNRADKQTNRISMKCRYGPHLSLIIKFPKESSLF